MKALNINTAKFIAITTLLHKNPTLALSVANELIADNKKHINNLSKQKNNTNILNIVKFDELNNKLQKVINYITINDEDSINDIIDLLANTITYALDAKNINAEALTTS
jgi:Zn-dependent oligopeptidase